MAPTGDYLDSFASGQLLKAIVAAFPLPKTIIERMTLEDALAPLPFFQAAAGTVTRLNKLVPSILMSTSDRNSPSVQLCRVPTNDEPLARLPEVLALDVYIYLTERTATTKSGSVYLDPLQKSFASHPAFVSGSVEGTLHDVLPRFSLFFSVYERKGRAAVKLNAVGSGKPMSEWSTIMFNSPQQLAARALNFAIKYPLPTQSVAAAVSGSGESADAAANNGGGDDVWDATSTPSKPPVITSSIFTPPGHDGSSSLFGTPSTEMPAPTFYSSLPLDNVFGSLSLNNHDGGTPLRPSTPTKLSPIVDPFNMGIPSLVSSMRCNVYLVQSAPKALYFANHLISLPRTHLALGGLGDLTRHPSTVALDAVTLAYPVHPTKSLVVIWDFARSPPDDVESMTHELRRVLQYAPTLVVHAGARLAEALEFQLGFPLPADCVYDVGELHAEWVRVSREAQGVLAMLDVMGEMSERVRMGKAQMVRLIAPIVGKGNSVGHHVASADLNLALHACQLPTNGDRVKVAAWAAHAEEKARKAVDGEQLVTRIKRYWDLHSDTIALARAAAYDVDQLVSAFAAMEARLTELITWLRRARSFLAVSQFRLGDGWSPNPALPKHVPVQAKFDAQSKIVWRYPTSTTTSAAANDADESGGTAANLDAAAVGLGGISQQLQRVHDQFMDKTQQEVADLMLLLPDRVRDAITAIPHATETLNEVILDLGEPPCLRFFAQGKAALDLNDVGIVTQDDLDSIVNGRKFSSDRRGGINGQLHRISWIPNRDGKAVGLTIRVGRACPPGEGVGQMLQDLVEEGESVLLLGKPGSGKTHTLRDLVARLSDKGNNVMIVDTSNEVGGPGDVKHFSLHKARRMQVRDRARQFEVLLEAVQNHTPDFVAIDEISDAKEVAAARSVVTRVQGMVATAHGDLESILRNKVMRDLVGGLQTATVGDARAKELGGRKMVTTRAEESLFSTVVELVSRTEVRVFKNVNRVVDDILHPHKYPWAERRWLEVGVSHTPNLAAEADGLAEVAGEDGAVGVEYCDGEQEVGEEEVVAENQEDKEEASGHRTYFWVRVEPFDEIELELHIIV